MSIRMETELDLVQLGWEFDACCKRRAWTLARAAACPWWAPIRRAILLWRARGLDQQADTLAAVLLWGAHRVPAWPSPQDRDGGA